MEYSQFRLTRQSACEANACYSDEKIAQLVPKEGLSPQEVGELSIPIKDRIWGLVYACGAPDCVLREYACWCADKALALAGNPDSNCAHAIKVARRYIKGGATEKEMRKALDAASFVAKDSLHNLSNAISFHRNTTLSANNTAAYNYLVHATLDASYVISYATCAVVAAANVFAPAANAAGQAGSNTVLVAAGVARQKALEDSSDTSLNSLDLIAGATLTAWETAAGAARYEQLKDLIHRLMPSG